MPFGNESTWDFCYHDNRNKQAIKSPMPFGNESTWDTETRRTRIEHLDVTNAFRQRVHLGPRTSYDIDFQWTRTTSERDMSCYCKS